MIKTVKLLIVEDERDVREPLARFLRQQGFEVQTAADGKEALEHLKESAVDVVVSDIQMPNMDGMELLRHLRSDHPSVDVIIFTAFGTIETAVDAIKTGAKDYVIKPIVFEDIQHKIERIVRERRAKDDTTGAPQRKQEYPILDSIKGNSTEIQKLKQLIKQVGRAGSFALIEGESGTGKELVARALHETSEHRNHPFLAINCAAIPEHLLESEVFGHAKGAFTGAIADKKGLFEAADGGTLFLDEVTDMSKAIQAKLLRAIEEQQITPLGKTQPVSVDVTIVAAAACHLKDEVVAGRFRDDLYFRINVVEIVLPPLRERKEDILPLAEHFLTETTKRLTSKATSFSPLVKSALERYYWPGNIRELRNVVERAVVLCHTDGIQAEDLPEFIAKNADTSENSSNYRTAVKDFEKDLILQTLKNCDNDKKMTAKILGIGLSSLYRKLEEFDFEEH